MDLESNLRKVESHLAGLRPLRDAVCQNSDHQATSASDPQTWHHVQAIITRYEELDTGCTAADEALGYGRKRVGSQPSWPATPVTVVHALPGIRSSLMSWGAPAWSRFRAAIHPDAPSPLPSPLP